MKTILVPGLPFKRYNPCIDPQQHPIPHVIKVFKYNKEDNLVSDSYAPNTADYSEYNYVIQMFIDNVVKEGKKLGQTRENKTDD